MYCSITHWNGRLPGCTINRRIQLDWPHLHTHTLDVYTNLYTLLTHSLHTHSHTHRSFDLALKPEKKLLHPNFTLIIDNHVVRDHQLKSFLYTGKVRGIALSPSLPPPPPLSLSLSLTLTLALPSLPHNNVQIHTHSCFVLMVYPSLVSCIAGVVPLLY